MAITQAIKFQQGFIVENKEKKSPKIGFLFPHPFSYSLGSTARLFSLAFNLKKLGIDVLIITPFEKTHTINGIKVVNIPNVFSNARLGDLSYRFARNIFSNKLLCRFFLRNIRKTSTVNGNIVKILQQLKLDILQIEHEPTAAVVLPVLKKLSLPAVLDFQGVWAEELVESGMITKKGPEYLTLQNTVAEAVSNIDATLVMSEAMKNYVIKNYGSTPNKVHVIELSAEPKIEKIPQKIAPPKVIYAGILSRNKNAQLFLESIPHIVKMKPSTQFFITNKGDLIDKAHSIAKTSGAHINFFWFSNQEQLFKLMSTCHVGVLTLPNNDSYKLNPAAKFFDYLSVGLPVVSNDIGGWISLIEEERTGILTKDDPVDFSRGVLKIICNPSLANTYGQNGLNLVREKYNANITCEKLANVYSALLSQKKTDNESRMD
jgi:glycosyltransferase involved in cell wall biosynthesis